MTIAVADVLTRLDILLLDAGKVRWTEPERLAWIVDACRQILIHKPDAASVTVEISLDAGTSRHDVPAGYLRLLDIVSDVTTGMPVTQTDLQGMDLRVPGWRKNTGPRLRHFMPIPDNPRAFYGWPKLTVAALVEATLVAEPPATLTAAGTLQFDSTYVGAVVDYVLYRAFSKDADDAFNGQRAIAHYQAFADAMGIKINTDKPKPGGTA